MKKLLKHIIYTASLLMFATQASAWVSKGFVPSNVDEMNVKIMDQANDGCWTNIGEVKRYAEDKLELAGHNVYRKRKDGFTGYKHYKLQIMVHSYRNASGCWGAVEFLLYNQPESEGITGTFLAGKFDAVFSSATNANQFTLKALGDFMKEVEDPQW